MVIVSKVNKMKLPDLSENVGLRRSVEGFATPSECL